MTIAVCLQFDNNSHHINPNSTAGRLGKQHWWTGCQPVKRRRHKAWTGLGRRLRESEGECQWASRARDQYVQTHDASIAIMHCCPQWTFIEFQSHCEPIHLSLGRLYGQLVTSSWSNFTVKVHSTHLLWSASCQLPTALTMRRHENFDGQRALRVGYMYWRQRTSCVQCLI